MKQSNFEHGSKWGHMPTSVHLQLPFFFKAEKYALLRKVLLVVFAACYSKLYTVAIENNSTLELIVATVAMMAFWLLYVQLHRLGKMLSRRQKITHNKVKREQRLSYRDKRIAFAKAKLMQEEKDKKQKELDAVDRRLQEAMKPVDWEAYKPRQQNTLKKVKTSSNKRLPKKQATPKRAKRPKTFKAVDIGDI